MDGWEGDGGKSSEQGARRLMRSSASYNIGLWFLAVKLESVVNFGCGNVSKSQCGCVTSTLTLLLLHGYLKIHFKLVSIQFI